MYVIEKTTGKRIEVEVQRVESSELKIIKRSREFGFDWVQVEGQKYKLISKGAGEIIALMGLIIRPEVGFRYVEVTAIEKRKLQEGKPHYDKIAGCLLTFAARESFRYELDGYVFLISKTELIDFYKTYGFKQTAETGPRMYSDTRNSIRLINEFL